MESPEKLVKMLNKVNPYPEDLFPEPNKDEWKKFHKALREAGLSPERFVGSCCRLGYNVCMEKLAALLSGEDEK